MFVAPSQAVYESVHVPAGQRGQACSATVDRRPRTITSRLGLGSCLRPHTRLEDGNFLVMLDGRRLSRRTHHRRHRVTGGGDAAASPSPASEEPGTGAIVSGAGAGARAAWVQDLPE